jgi:HEAT repeat protein
MKRSTILAALLCFLITTSGHTQDAGSKQRKKDDLPDVSLVIPEDTRPEVKAIIKANAKALSSKKASERMKAAQVLGELEEQGKPLRGLLCRAMLDPIPEVRTAAADALKNIDPKIQYLAVALVTEENKGKLDQLLTKLQKLEEDGEPLAPLVAHIAIGIAAERSPYRLPNALTTLSHIAKRDLGACQLVASGLDNRDASVRLAALQGMTRMKHGRLAIPKMILLLKTDTAQNRIAVIQGLAALADETTEEIVTAAITSQRYHKDESVRRAVEIALNKLQNK